ncbi:MAG: type IV pilus assembly protein FimV [Planctomycetota bacterium]
MERSLCIIVALLIACSAVTVCGCSAPSEQTADDGVTIGKGRIEDTPDTDETENGSGEEERIIVDPTLIPRKKTPEEIEAEKKFQAEIEKEYKKISDLADRWAAEERAWIKKGLAEADLRMAEGNLTEAEKILKGISKKWPDNVEAAKRLLEIESRRREATEIDDPEERIIKLVKNGERLRTEGQYRASYLLYLEAKRVMETVKNSPAAARMKPEIEQNLKELKKLLPPENVPEKPKGKGKDKSSGGKKEKSKPSG